MVRTKYTEKKHKSGAAAKAEQPKKAKKLDAAAKAKALDKPLAKKTKKAAKPAKPAKKAAASESDDSDSDSGQLESDSESESEEESAASESSEDEEDVSVALRIRDEDGAPGVVGGDGDARDKARKAKVRAARREARSIYRSHVERGEDLELPSLKAATSRRVLAVLLGGGGMSIVRSAAAVDILGLAHGFMRDRVVPAARDAQLAAHAEWKPRAADLQDASRMTDDERGVEMERRADLTEQRIQAQQFDTTLRLSVVHNEFGKLVERLGGSREEFAAFRAALDADPARVAKLAHAADAAKKEKERTAWRDAIAALQKLEKDHALSEPERRALADNMCKELEWSFESNKAKHNRALAARNAAEDAADNATNKEIPALKARIRELEADDVEAPTAIAHTRAELARGEALLAEQEEAVFKLNGVRNEASALARKARNVTRALVAMLTKRVESMVAKVARHRASIVKKEALVPEKRAAVVRLEADVAELTKKRRHCAESLRRYADQFGK